MGILHSTSRFFGCKTEDEEEKGGDSSEQFPKSSACSSILSAILQGFRFLFRFLWRRKTANHLLPIQNTSREPLLGQAAYRSQRGTVDVLSSQQIKEQKDRDLVPSVPRLTISLNSDEGKSFRGIDEYLSYKQWWTEKKQRDIRDALLSTHPLSCVNPSCKEVASSSTVSVRKDAPRNVPIVGMKKADREEGKQVTSSSTVSVRKDAPRNVPIVGMKKADREEGKQVSSSSTVFVRKDVPRNVPIVGMKKADRDEGKQASSSSTVFVRKDAPRNVPIVGMKKADRDEGKQVSSSSTVFVRKDAPRNVPIVGMKKADREEEKQVISSSTVSVRKDAPRKVPIAKERLGKKKEEKKVSIRSSIIDVVVSNERWIKHYSSRHRILLVGEGDFSFSASLALAFSSASNIIATSLNSQEFLKINYSRAASNIEQLRRSESRVMHEVDATKIANHPSLGHVKFDRIIFNFPYAGLANIKKLPREAQLGCHRRLVRQFLKNAKKMISENGEIHISHKTNSFHVEFDLESIASDHRLRLIEAVNFNCLDYPGYNTKSGFGGDNNFDCSPSKTYKFGIKKLQYY
ncbi:hypothetical protein ACS0TY_032465 [Phlomoides rotata]